MIQRQFLSTLLWLIGVNLLIKVTFVFGIDMQVQHRVGQSAYGLYFVLLNLTYIFQILHDFGLNLLHGTDTAHHGRIRREQWVGILRTKMGLSLLYSAVVMLMALILGYGASWPLLLWLVANNILVSWIAVLRSGIAGMARYRMEAIISVMDKALMVAICGALLLSSSTFRIEWFVWAQTTSLVLTAGLAWWVSRPMWKEMEHGEPVQISRILRDALPFSIAVFLMFVYTRVDSILIGKLLPDGSHEVGVYAAGYRLFDAANMIAFLFTPLLIPMYARLRNDPEETSKLIQMARGIMVFLGGMIAITGYLWAEEIMGLLYGHTDAQWVDTFRWLILAHIPVGLMYIYGSYLTAIRLLRPQNILFVIAVAANIGLNLFAIPRWGTVGAAITALVTQSVTATGLIILVSTKLRWQQGYKRWILPVSYMITMGLVGWLLSSLSMPWWIEAGCFLLIGLVAAFLFRLLHVQAFMDVVKQRMG